MEDYIITNSGECINSAKDFINFLESEIETSEHKIYSIDCSLYNRHLSIKMNIIENEAVVNISRIIIMKKDESFSKFKNIFLDLKNNNFVPHGFLKGLILPLKGMVLSENFVINDNDIKKVAINDRINNNSVGFINIDYLLPLDKFYLHYYCPITIDEVYSAVSISVKDLPDDGYIFCLNKDEIKELYKIKKERLSDSEYVVFNMLVETSERGNEFSAMINEKIEGE